MHEIDDVTITDLYTIIINSDMSYSIHRITATEISTKSPFVLFEVNNAVFDKIEFALQTRKYLERELRSMLLRIELEISMVIEEERGIAYIS